MNKTGPDTKTLIRQEALRLFAERGFSAVSMRELADAVGMRQGGLYNHFGSKHDLLVDLMTRHMELLLDACDAALADISDPAARLDAFVRFHVGYHLEFPRDVFIAYMELRSLEGDAREAVIGLRDRYENVLCDILKDGVGEGVFVIRDPAVHARMLLSMLTGVTAWFRDGGRLSRDVIVDCYVTGALQSVGLAAPKTGTP